MKFEPQTFFIGVIDLFSIMLPGALATALLRRAAEPMLFPAVFPPHTDNTARWAIFLFASYLLGHFIFLFGSILDDLIYDRLRRRADEEFFLLKKIKPLIDEANKEGKIGLLCEIAKQVETATDAKKAVQVQMLEKLKEAVEETCDKLQTARDCEMPDALIKIREDLRDYFSNRSRRWRPIRRWIFKQFFSATPDLALNRVREIKRGHVPDVKEQAVINAFQWCKARLAIQCPAALAEVQRLEADSKFFRSLLIVLACLLGWLFSRAMRGESSWVLVVFCFVFSILSFWRYVERRFKSTEQAYWYIITLGGDATARPGKQ